MEERDPTWLAYHLFPEDLDRALLGLVRPLAAELLAGRLIESFFFVRYREGGPHLRLRLRPASGRAAAAAARARELLSPLPAAARLEAAFAPETERYGGAQLLDESLRFFAVSSVAALELLDLHDGEPRARRLAVAFTVLAAQAAGFARDTGELGALLAYGIDSWGQTRPKALAQAERVLATGRQGFLHLFRRALAAAGTAAGPGPEAPMAPEALEAPRTLESPPEAVLAEASHRLSRACRDATPRTRLRIGTSQLHMTANRLGLTNGEEVYLGRFLTAIAADLLTAGEGGADLPATTESATDLPTAAEGAAVQVTAGEGTAGLPTVSEGTGGLPAPSDGAAVQVTVSQGTADLPTPAEGAAAPAAPAQTVEPADSGGLPRPAWIARELAAEEGCSLVAMLPEVLARLRGFRSDP